MHDCTIIYLFIFKFRGNSDPSEREPLTVNSRKRKTIEWNVDKCLKCKVGFNMKKHVTMTLHREVELRNRKYKGLLFNAQ